MIDILITLLLLGILVLVHETGHFLVARRFGVTIEKFSIGFGTRLWGFTKNGTEYVISLIPLGGYVKMKGENPDENRKGEEDEFGSKTWWQRALIAFAGPFANLLFAFLLFMVSFLYGRDYTDQLPIISKVNKAYESYFNKGDRVISVNNKNVRGWSDIAQFTTNGSNSYTINRNNEEISVEVPQITQTSWFTDLYPQVPAIIGEVTPGMPAYRAGMMDNDKVISIDGKPVGDWYEMRDLIANNKNKSIMIVIERNGRQVQKRIDLETNVLDNNNSKIIGIQQYMPIKMTERYNILESAKLSGISTITFVVANYVGLYKLIQKPSTLKDNIGGPVMMYSMSKQTTKKGFTTFLSFMAAISIILMIMNLLPIPILDGGHIFFCFLEGILRKPLSIKVQMVLQQIGFSFLLFLMIFAFYSDFSRVAKRQISIHQAGQDSVRAK